VLYIKKPQDYYSAGVVHCCKFGSRRIGSRYVHRCFVENPMAKKLQENWAIFAEITAIYQ
jgi:hypothetical protein